MTPLSSLKVLDFSGLLPGPYASMMLADLGAEVLRVESPTRPDLVREIHPFDNNVRSPPSTVFSTAPSEPSRWT